MITSEQLRAARALLDWTRLELAEVANISPETIKNIECSYFKKPHAKSIEKLVQAFAGHGVDFIELKSVSTDELKAVGVTLLPVDKQKPTAKRKK